MSSCVDSRRLQDSWQRQWWYNQGQCSGGKRLFTFYNSTCIALKILSDKMSTRLFTVAAADHVLLSDGPACGW